MNGTALIPRTPRASLAATLLLAGAALGWTQSTEVTYFEGAPRHRDSAGKLSPLDYDSQLKAGDSVLTGKSDTAELTQGDLAVIQVKPNTVFTIREIETAGQKEQVLTTSVGAVAMRFNRLAGKEPRIGTVSTVAGIRGTEVTVYAGPDGSSLFVVDSGLVAVTAAGQTVELAEKEGVEVPAGGPPGEKFSVIGREQNFSAWAESKTEAFLADPEAALVKVDAMMAQLKDGLDEWVGKYKQAKVESAAANEKLKAITDAAEQKKFQDEVWLPLVQKTGNSILNFRYYTLSALSLRRYVLGPMYVQMKTRSILEPKQTAAFFSNYKTVLNTYKATFEPYLSDIDY